MMRSLYSGVSGLKTHQTKIDVIGNNIANVNTTAYKSQSINFASLMYQTTQSASGANTTTGTAGTNAKQIGLGVKTAAISTSISTAGSTQTTGNPFDISISGDSFFIVSDGSNNYFTRDGSFYVDSLGNLAMSSNGYNVMGWSVDETTGTIVKDTVQALRIMSAANLTYPPEATTKAYLSGIIDKNDTQVNSEDGKLISLSIYDSLGYAYTVKFTMKATDNDGEYSLELYSVLDENGDEIDSSSFTLGTTQAIEAAADLTLNSNYTLEGNVLTYKDDDLNDVTITISSNMTDEEKEILAQAYGYSTYEEFSKLYVDDGTGNTTTVAQMIAAGTFSTTSDYIDDDGTLSVAGRYITGGTIQYDTSTGLVSSVNGLSNNLTLTLDFGDADVSNGGAFESIEIDLSNTYNYNNSGTSTISADPGDTDGLGTGRKLGNMSSISIQTDGMIYASYDNGMTRLLGQIAVAEFSNASGLEMVGDNLYQATLNSGTFDGVGVDITASGGYMTTGTLEMSNVDLSSEFTELIVAQRGFQANSRIITVSDSLLEELINLKR